MAESALPAGSAETSLPTPELTAPLQGGGVEPGEPAPTVVPAEMPPIAVEESRGPAEESQTVSSPEPNHVPNFSAAEEILPPAGEGVGMWESVPPVVPSETPTTAEIFSPPEGGEVGMGESAPVVPAEIPLPVPEVTQQVEGEGVGFVESAPMVVPAETPHLAVEESFGPALQSLSDGPGEQSHVTSSFPAAEEIPPQENSGVGIWDSMPPVVPAETPITEEVFSLPQGGAVERGESAPLVVPAETPLPAENIIPPTGGEGLGSPEPTRLAVPVETPFTASAENLPPEGEEIGLAESVLLAVPVETPPTAAEFIPQAEGGEMGMSESALPFIPVETPFPSGGEIPPPEVGEQGLSASPVAVETPYPAPAEILPPEGGAVERGASAPTVVSGETPLPTPDFTPPAEVGEFGLSEPEQPVIPAETPLLTTEVPPLPESGAVEMEASAPPVVPAETPLPLEEVTPLPVAGVLGSETIAAVLRDFEDWLSQVSTEAVESSPSPEPTIDLNTLLGQFLALKHEVNLQTRAVRGQQEQNAETLRKLSLAVELLAETPAPAPPPQQASPSDEILRPLLKTLVDLYDALTLAEREVERVQENVLPLLESLRREDAAGEVTPPPQPQSGQPASGAKPSLWSRWLSPGSSSPSLPRDVTLDRWLEQQRRDQQLRREQDQQLQEAAERARQMLSSLLAGYTMSLQRLDRALEQQGLEIIETTGELFDPERMEVLEAVTGSGRSAGEVLEEVRRGYLWKGRVFRFAQVRVARS